MSQHLNSGIEPTQLPALAPRKQARKEEAKRNCISVNPLPKIPFAGNLKRRRDFLSVFCELNFFVIKTVYKRRPGLPCSALVRLSFAPRINGGPGTHATAAWPLPVPEINGGAGPGTTTSASTGAGPWTTGACPLAVPGINPGQLLVLPDESAALEGHRVEL